MFTGKDGQPVYYSVTTSSSSAVTGNVRDGTTETFSHEYAEMATDPSAGNGWLSDTGKQAPNEEIADMNDDFNGGADDFVTDVAGSGNKYAFEQLWSNQANGFV